MGTPLGPKYILYSYMDPLGTKFHELPSPKGSLRQGMIPVLGSPIPPTNGTNRQEEDSKLGRSRLQTVPNQSCFS